MNIRYLAALLALAATDAVHGQAGTGATWDSFGPDRSSGVFLNITREHLSSQNAYGIAVDRQQRVLVLNEWRETGNTNVDCGVTRHLNNARLLDMSYTGGDELEGTRRVAADMGSSNVDLCTAIDVDSGNRAVVSGWGASTTGLSGFLVRLTASGAYDTGFSSDGKLALKNLVPFLGLQSRLNHVLAVGSSILACGWVERGGSRNMMILRVTSSGTLDTTFSGNGYVEVDFNVDGERNDSCSRMVVLPNGDIVAGGIITDSAGNEAYGLTRLNSAGSFVGSFANQGRLIIDDGSALAATPYLTDIAWDSGRNRLMVACSLAFSANLEPSGCVLAVRGNTGTLDPAFDGDGRKAFRFSSYGSNAPREPGGTHVRRLLMRDDGSFYVLGTHDNSDADAQTYGASDAVTLRMEADGSVVESGASAYSTDGIQFHTLAEVTQGNVSDSSRRRVVEDIVDATWYHGNPLFLADRQRYPTFVFDHDGDGNLNEPGPIAPVVAAITGEQLFGADFDFDGLPPSPSATPTMATPIGYGNYCSVRNATGGGFGLLPQGSGSDPCQVFLDSNPTAIIERSGMYSLSGLNWVIGVCSGNFITLRGGNGTQPFDQAFADAAARTNCVFTATPGELPIFSRPYTGTHSGIGNTQSFNHDPYNIPVDVTEFGQTAGPFDACAIDNRGRQRSIGNPNAVPSTCNYDNSGVNEPAMDIDVTSSRYVASTATGRVAMAVPRHVPNYAPAGMDPWQREVFVRHQVGAGRYAEIFTTYYAHMQDTAVRRGDAVSAGTVIGRVGTTGASTGEHLHLSVIRHRNLSFRSAFEFRFEGGQHDRDASVAAFDPWGWMAPQGVDPWAWRFRNHADNPLLDDAGTFSSNLWISGEAPPLN
ncbi:MAG TPA: peptidoglycan DD-metalloendopeptidase family protein [Dokdonella sp.]|nr:peptidoglycan DD-metalloendopeptidase family protein [Dokdonella sp.]HQY54307.1 peptidoglycan DD-metalloendopeptidase family protein [Dokdonella sp.]HQZ63097.1 peptidoglycan DD-metalloendopeptidase family protein [Dokdonella sp.]